jgi:hypothetical protein
MKPIKNASELRTAIAEGRYRFRICLIFGLFSRKTITLADDGRFDVFSHFGGSFKRLTEAELFTKSNIGEAMRQGAFGAEVPNHYQPCP